MLLGHNYIGPQHLLLGLTRELNGVGVKALESLGISLQLIREQVIALDGRLGGNELPKNIPWTPRAKKALELATQESAEGRVDTEHILLGLIQERESIAAVVLAHFGADYARTQAAITTVLEAENLAIALELEQALERLEKEPPRP